MAMFQKAHCAIAPESLFCKGLGETDVQLYKLFGGECAQTTLNQTFESYVEKATGMLEGSCSTQGYTVDQGEKSMNLPIVGTIQLALYAKPARKAGEMVDLYRIAKGECGQATIPAVYEKPAEEFAGLTEGTCAKQGYTTLDGEKDMKVPIIGEIKVDLYSKPAKKYTATEATVFRVALGECGEATVPTFAENWLEKYANMAEGTCATQGYTVEDKTETVKIPVVGDITVSLYKKTADAVSTDVPATSYRVIKGECGQVTTDAWLEKYIEEYAQFTAGTCASQGYTHVDGDQKITLPVVGEVDVELASKPAEAQHAHKSGIRMIMEKINKMTGHHSKHHHRHHHHHQQMI